MDNNQTATLSTTQSRALQLMNEQNIGCLIVKGFGWVWPTHIRNDYGLFGDVRANDAARLVIEKLEAK